MVYHNGKFLPGKSILHQEKSDEMTLPPQQNIPVMPLELMQKVYIWVNIYRPTAGQCITWFIGGLK